MQATVKNFSLLNPMLVNGQVVDTHVLNDKDVFTVGERCFRYRNAKLAAPAKPAAAGISSVLDDIKKKGGFKSTAPFGTICLKTNIPLRQR
jgi:hypothetical protein